MSAGYLDVALEVFRAIDWGEVKYLSPFLRSRFKRYVQKGDELDRRGLVQDSITPFLNALAIRKRSCKVLIRLSNVHWQLANYADAREFLQQAKLYANSRRDRYNVSHVEFQLVFSDFEKAPTLSLAEKGLSLMEQASNDFPGCAFSQGRKALFCLEALNLIPNLSEMEKQRYSILAELSFQKSIENAAKGTATDHKYLNRILMELPSHPQTKGSTFWIAQMENARTTLKQEPKRKARFVRKFFASLLPSLCWLCFSVVAGGIGVLDCIDLG